MASKPLVTVSTRVMSHEIGGKCVEGVQKIFPDFSVENIPAEEEFPVRRGEVKLICDNLSPNYFLQLLTEQRILDTALDAMALNLHPPSTTFLLSRQAALSGKVAFVLETERTVGGVIEVTFVCDDIVDWLQEATWHPGRRDVPRSVGDDLSMRNDGSVTEWFDKKGHATMQTED